MEALWTKLPTSNKEHHTLRQVSRAFRKISDATHGMSLKITYRCELQDDDLDLEQLRAHSCSPEEVGRGFARALDAYHAMVAALNILRALESSPLSEEQQDELGRLRKAGLITIDGKATCSLVKYLHIHLTTRTITESIADAVNSFLAICPSLKGIKISQSSVIDGLDGNGVDYRILDGIYSRNDRIRYFHPPQRFSSSMFNKLPDTTQHGLSYLQVLRYSTNRWLVTAADLEQCIPFVLPHLHTLEILIDQGSPRVPLGVRHSPLAPFKGMLSPKLTKITLRTWHDVPEIRPFFVRYSANLRYLVYERMCHSAPPVASILPAFPLLKTLLLASVHASEMLPYGLRWQSLETIGLSRYHPLPFQNADSIEARQDCISQLVCRLQEDEDNSFPKLWQFILPEYVWEFDECVSTMLDRFKALKHKRLEECEHVSSMTVDNWYGN